MLNEAAGIRRQINDVEGLNITEHNIGFLVVEAPCPDRISSQRLR
jgi:hypothetical protein